MGYYRLLYGISRKFFYEQGPFGEFRRLEDRGEIPPRVVGRVAALCRSLIVTGADLVGSVDGFSLQLIHELQLLTVGVQLRRGSNTTIGQVAARSVLALVREMVADHIVAETPCDQHQVNASGRRVLIQVSNDPDILITEELGTSARRLVSIEIKGGRDRSNIHNRIGEAEKSHQKARAAGCFEFWTLIAVPRRLVDADRLRQESPTTSRFFHIDEIRDRTSVAHRQFADLLASVTGTRRSSSDANA